MDDQTQGTQAKKGMNPMYIAGIVILVLVIAGGIFLGSKKGASQKQAMQEPTPTVAVKATTTATGSATASPAATGTAITTPAAVKEFTVHGGSFYFKPNQIIVKKGDTVTINFINDGGFHDFVLDEFNVKTATIGSGRSDTVTFTANKTGTFQYYCSVGNHKAMGMVGTLVVQ